MTGTDVGSSRRDDAVGVEQDDGLAYGRRSPTFVSSPYGMAGFAILVLLGGCEVGPDFVPPVSPSITTYTSQEVTPTLAPSGGEPSQRLVSGREIPAAWWQMFHSSALDSVVRQAIEGSPSIEAARGTLAQARQTVLQTRGTYYPQVDAGASVERQQGPASSLVQTKPGQGLPVFNLYSLGPVASFSPDVFGLTARRVEQQTALADVQGYQLTAAQLVITGNVVAQALTIASARRQIDAIKGIVADDERNLALVRDRAAAGRGARIDVLTAETQLANDRAQIPPLGQQLAIAEDALAVLVGKPPSEWTPPAFDLADFTLPAELPVSLPSALVRQRPDILAAEAQLHASSAAIGVATAQMYPDISLSGSFETAALSATSLFDRSSVVWTLAAGLTAPIFHGGALEAQKQGAIEGFNTSLATWRQTVLQAFGQVADILRALGHDADFVEAERRAFESANEARDLQRLSYEAGKTDVLRLLDAERSAQQAQLGYARAQAQRYLDSAQLVVAMGGGWWQGAIVPAATPSVEAHP